MNRLCNIKTYGMLLALLMSRVLFAQDINTTQFPVQLSIQAKASIYLAGFDTADTLQISKSTESKLSPKSSSKTWINYSSVVEGNSTNTIYVSLSSEDLPPEVIIKLNISEDAGEGSGKMGKPSKPIVLTNYPQGIITEIGSCYTGQGTKKGHLLTYTWVLDPNYDPKDFKMEELNVAIGVIYTITNNE